MHAEVNTTEGNDSTPGDCNSYAQSHGVLKISIVGYLMHDFHNVNYGLLML